MDSPFPIDAAGSAGPIGYNVHTAADAAAMLSSMGLSSVDQLFEDVPAAVRLRRPLELPAPLTEWELQRDVRDMGAANATTSSHLCFLGSGAYDHYIPAVVDAVASRGEFLTAYTPYQPEMSQGLLQALFEFQALMGRLLGQESVNCSVYDGATALAEACWMMCSASGKRHVVVAQALFSDHGEVLRTYLGPRGVEVEVAAADPVTGLSSPEEVARLVRPAQTAGVALQTPNAFGVVEDVRAIASVCQQAGTSLCVSVNPLLCGWTEAPGALGADIVTCEAQPLGLPLAAGGPYLGVIACSKAFERYLPGRLVGKVHDLHGRLAYALVKEDREQHVARDKATSHICSNQALNAVRVATYLACVGESNFMRLAQANADGAARLRALLLAVPGVRPLRDGAHFNEFAIELPVSAVSFRDAMLARGILAGVPIEAALAGHERGLLVAVTEARSELEVERYAQAAAACLGGGTP